MIESRLAKTDEEFRTEYENNLMMSWIYHDSALEGVVYTYDELRTGTSSEVSVIPDSSVQSVCDAVRRHREAILLVRQLGKQPEVPIDLALLKRIHWTLHPVSDGPEAVPYRADIPQHRLYFHEYCEPAQIHEKVVGVFEWLDGPEPRKLKSALRVASKFHYDLLRIFPVRQRQRQSGAAPDEPVLTAFRSSAGNHSPDRTSALLRGSQRLAERDFRHAARGGRQWPTERRAHSGRTRDTPPRHRLTVERRPHSGVVGDR